MPFSHSFTAYRTHSRFTVTVAYNVQVPSMFTFYNNTIQICTLHTGGISG